MAAVVLMCLLGFAAFSVDLGNVWTQQSRMQTASDAAALSAVARSGIDDAAAIAQRGKHYAALNLSGNVKDENGDPVEEASITVEQGHWDSAHRTFTATDFQPNAVSVTASRTSASGNAVSSWFSQLVGIDHFDVTTRSIAVKRSSLCLLALEPFAAKAVELSGGSAISMPECDVWVNSTGSPALRGSGNSSVIAANICVVGSHDVQGTLEPAPQADCKPMADPLAGLAPPVYGGCDHNKLTYSGGTRTLSPGVYCGGLVLSGGAVATFLPGVYVMKDGPLKTSGGSTMTGDGVGFYFTGKKASIDVSGGGGVHFKAPRTGPLTGLVFFQGPDAEKGLTSKLSGQSEMYYEGTIYLPDQNVEMSGTSTAAAPPYTILILNELLISGGGTITINSDFGASDVPVAVPGAGRKAALVK